MCKIARVNETSVETVRAAEFFAGIGLVRLALGQCGVDVVWANDIEQSKLTMYADNFGSEHFVLGDVRTLEGADLPQVDLATASFPCTDLSLAGNRGGIRSGESSMFWEFARIIAELGDSRPTALLLENVPGFATSHGGRDLHDAVRELNRLGYSCDVFAVNADRFVPQSRLRMFIVGLQSTAFPRMPESGDVLRPKWLERFYASNGSLRLHAAPIALPDRSAPSFASVADRLSPHDPRWWEADRVERFVESLAPIQFERLAALRHASRYQFRTAYRRTRHGQATWEIRSDDVAGCLRTARGGSSKQAVVQAGRGKLAVRWMTASEYASLQGAPDFRFGSVSENKALFGFGDAVCVPVIRWIAQSYLVPAVSERARFAA